MFYISRTNSPRLILSTNFVTLSRHKWKVTPSLNLECTPWFLDIVNRNAGHSKWANIKHTKGLKDAQRAAAFTKLGRLMTVAIRDGGSHDPKHNLQLAHVIEQAKRKNMPSGTVQSIIKSAQVSKEAAKPALLEFRGPGGCVIIADILTDNFAKTKQTISTILRKNNAVFSEGGSRHLFDRKGVVEAVPATTGVTNDAAVEHAIEAGAEDVFQITSQENKTLFRFLCATDKIHQVQIKLQELNYIIEMVDQEFTPHTLVKLTDNELESASQLCDKLQENPDVVRLYDNIS